MIKIATLVVLPLFLSACGGGGGSQVLDDPGDLTELDVYNPEGPVINACSASYFQEITGEYEGSIYYANEPVLCEWNVNLQISSQYDPLDLSRSYCELSYNVMSNTPILADKCSDIGTGGEYLSAFGIEDVAGGWENPPWPISGIATIGTDLTNGLVYPVGGGHVNSFNIEFDGTGNAYFTNDLIWSGVLVKVPAE